MDRVIERGSEVMNDFTCENSKARRYGDLGRCCKDVIPCIKLQLSNHAIRFLVRPERIGDFDVEVADVFFGPLDLRSNSDEQVR